MKITVKREELFGLDAALESAGKLSSTRFAYAVAKNKKVIQTEIEAMRVALSPPKRVLEFEEKRRNLVLEMADRGKDGNPIVDHAGNARIPDVGKFNERIETLKSEYKDDLEEHDSKKEEHEAFLKEEIELEVHEIPTKHLAEGLTGKDVQSLLPLITGDPSEIPE